MPPEHFQKIYPYFFTWIDTTLRTHTQWSRTVASAGFKRLPLYFNSELLNRAKFVTVAKVPIPPLTALGLEQFADFQRLEAGGITYMDTYFVRQELATNERLHFHELIHVVQWLTLGPEKFFFTYANGLERFGYRNNPLEVMAYDAEEAFARAKNPFDAEAMIKNKARLF